MTTLDDEVLTQIQFHVRSGFFNPAEVEEHVLDYFSNQPDRRSVQAAISQETKRLKSEMKDWPTKTDWDRLYDAFFDIADEWIIAIHNAGYTQSDGYDEFRSTLENLVHQQSIIGYCFYTLQDVGSALDFGEMCLAFGPANPTDEETTGVEVGKKIVKILDHHGLKTEWNGKFNERIKLVDVTLCSRIITRSVSEGHGAVSSLCPSLTRRVGICEQIM